MDWLTNRLWRRWRNSREDLYQRNQREWECDSFFLVKDKIFWHHQNGNPYIKLKLGDRTGEMEGRIWTSVEVFVSILWEGWFCSIWPEKITSFQNHLKLISPISKRFGEWFNSSRWLFPMTEKNIDEMFQSLITISQQVKNPHLNRPSQSFLGGRKTLLIGLK